MHAVIGRDGSIDSLEVLSGHPLLVKGGARCGPAVALSPDPAGWRARRSRDVHHSAFCAGILSVTGPPSEKNGALLTATPRPPGSFQSVIASESKSGKRRPPE